jgi:hypothetical protein
VSRVKRFASAAIAKHLGASVPTGTVTQEPDIEFAHIAVEDLRELRPLAEKIEEVTRD